MTRTSPLYARSLRGWLRHLASTDRLAVAREGVSLEYELAGIAKKLDGRQAVGVYEITADRRSAAGTWGWIGEDSRHGETITRSDEP